MSDREGTYSLESPVMAYNPRSPISNPTSALAPRRTARASYRPALSPPPAIALPATPSFTPTPGTGTGYQQQLPMRISNNQSPVGRGYSSSHHPYSAHSLASTPDIDNDLSDGFNSNNDRNYRNLYRSQAHQSPVSTHSQAQSLNFSARLQTSSSMGSIPHQPQQESDLAYASTSSPVRDRTANVSPGSYFAAYPPVPASHSRERSDSESSAVSANSSAHTASAAALSLPTPVQSTPRPREQTQSSSHRHASGTSPHSHKNKPSSRRALTAALELAKSAVLLDQTNDDPRGAVQAYANTVRLLGEVMERVMRGEDPPSSSSTAPGYNSSSGADAAAEDRRRRGRRKSNVVAKEEEVRRLKAIHDTYADRLTILCLIYSIPHPSPLDRPVGGPSSEFTPSNQLSPSAAPPTGPSPPPLPPNEPPEQIGSNLSFGDSDQDAQSLPDAPEDIHSDDLSLEDGAADTATIRKGYPSSGADSELESESDWERKILSRDNPPTRVDSSFAAYRQQQQQQTYYSPHVPEQNGSTHVGGYDNAETPRRLHSGSNATRAMSQDTPAPIPTSVSLNSFRNSVIPPPRPPPSGPLPTRPRIASGTNIPPQLLNQPLPPLPPVPKPQSPLESLQYAPPSNQPRTITRQSSASSVSAVSGASSNASGSSSASTFLGGQPPNANVLLSSALPPSSSASASVSQPPVNATLSLPGSSGIPTRSRGNSNAHVRNLSNAERLGAVNEEKEEDEGTIRKGVLPAPSTTPPQEHKYRSRSSSMVSLKDRDRAKAQVLGALVQLPLPPLPAVQKQPSAETLSEPQPLPLPSPNTANFGAKATPRQRGSSVGSSVTQASDDYIGSGSSPSTTPVANMPPYTAGGAPAPGSAPIIVPGAVGGSALEGSVKLNPNTKEGTISQRRSQATSGSQSGHGKLTSAVLPAATATSLGLTGRNRSSSNPGKWSTGISNGESTTRPPMPPPPMSAGPRRHFPTPSVVRYQPFGLPSPSGSANASSASLVPTAANGAPIAGVPSSPLPSPPPALAILRPYHLMSLLRKSISDRSGGYITPRLHVPHEVWTQGSAKLTNSAEKTKVIDVLVAALDELTNASIDFCGASSGIASSTGGGERKQGERWAGKLEDFDRAFNQLGMTFGKKLGVGEGFVVKKSVGMAAWGNKFFDKIGAVGKPYDSPIAYASLLTKLFAQVQLLDEHSRASHMSPQPPAYTSLPQDVRNRIDSSLKNISELFAKVVLTFVFRDLSLMLDKYHKTCDRWIQSNPGNPP